MILMLVKKITKVGNSWAVILPNEIMQSSGLVPGGECEFHPKKEGILLKPHFKPKSKDKKIAEATARFIAKYRNDLKKLA